MVAKSGNDTQLSSFDTPATPVVETKDNSAVYRETKTEDRRKIKASFQRRGRELQNGTFGWSTAPPTVDTENSQDPYLELKKARNTALEGRETPVYRPTVRSDLPRSGNGGASVLRRVTLQRRGLIQRPKNTYQTPMRTEQQLAPKFDSVDGRPRDAGFDHPTPSSSTTHTTRETVVPVAEVHQRDARIIDLQTKLKEETSKNADLQQLADRSKIKDYDNEALKVELADAKAQLAEALRLLDTTSSQLEQVSKQRTQSMRDWELSRPSSTRVNEVIKQIKQKNLLLKDRRQWPLLKQFIRRQRGMEMWPKYLLDFDAPTWTQDQVETPQEKRGRMELFMVLRDCVENTRHGSKLDSVMVDDDVHDAQGLWRKYEEVFGYGHQEGDVKALMEHLTACSMKSTGLAYDDYCREYLERIKALKCLDVEINEPKVLVTNFIDGLLESFNNIKNNFNEKKLEDDDFQAAKTLEAAMTWVQKRAVVAKLMNHRYKNGKNTVTQNNTNTKPSAGKGDKKEKKSRTKKRTEKIKQLEAQIEELKKTSPGDTAAANGGTADQLNANSKKQKEQGTKMCKYGKDCFANNCTYRHPPGRQQCKKCSKFGHTEDKCGKCWACGVAGHSAGACPSRSTEGQANVHQGVQEVCAPERDDQLCILRPPTRS